MLFDRIRFPSNGMENQIEHWKTGMHIGSTCVAAPSNTIEDTENWIERKMCKMYPHPCECVGLRQTKRLKDKATGKQFDTTQMLQMGARENVFHFIPSSQFAYSIDSILFLHFNVEMKESQHLKSAAKLHFLVSAHRRAKTVLIFKHFVQFGSR